MVMTLVLLILLTGCGVRGDERRLDGMVYAYKYACNREEALRVEVELIDGVEDAVVTINGGSALVSVNLVGEPLSDEIVRLKGVIRDRVMAFDGELERVAVSVGFEMFRRVSEGETRKIPPEKRRLFPVVPTF